MGSGTAWRDVLASRHLLVRDIAALQPDFVSEHLSFTRPRPRRGDVPVEVGVLMPPLQVEAGVAAAAQRIRQRRIALGDTPLAIETAVSYLPPASGEWPDGAFVAAVADASDCGIPPDLHNGPRFRAARRGRQRAGTSTSMPCSRFRVT
jgi:uncharacterized protein